MALSHVSKEIAPNDKSKLLSLLFGENTSWIIPSDDENGLGQRIDSCNGKIRYCGDKTDDEEKQRRYDTDTETFDPCKNHTSKVVLIKHDMSNQYLPARLSAFNTKTHEYVAELVDGDIIICRLISRELISCPPTTSMIYQNEKWKVYFGLEVENAMMNLLRLYIHTIEWVKNVAIEHENDETIKKYLKSVEFVKKTAEGWIVNHLVEDIELEELIPVTTLAESISFYSLPKFKVHITNEIEKLKESRKTMQQITVASFELFRTYHTLKSVSHLLMLPWQYLSDGNKRIISTDGIIDMRYEKQIVDIFDAFGNDGYAYLLKNAFDIQVDEGSMTLPDDEQAEHSVSHDDSVMDSDEKKVLNASDIHVNENGSMSHSDDEHSVSHDDNSDMDSDDEELWKEGEVVSDGLETDKCVFVRLLNHGEVKVSVRSLTFQRNFFREGMKALYNNITCEVVKAHADNADIKTFDGVLVEAIDKKALCHNQLIYSYNDFKKGDLVMAEIKSYDNEDSSDVEDSQSSQDVNSRDEFIAKLKLAVTQIKTLPSNVLTETRTKITGLRTIRYDKLIETLGKRTVFDNDKHFVHLRYISFDENEELNSPDMKYCQDLHNQCSQYYCEEVSEFLEDDGLHEFTTLEEQYVVYSSDEDQVERVNSDICLKRRQDSESEAELDLSGEELDESDNEEIEKEVFKKKQRLEELEKFKKTFTGFL